MKNWEVLAMPSSSSLGSSSKRARAPTNGTETTTVVCSVDGCTSDLNKCRDYHRRHKVCEVHSKTPKVMIGDQEQRFCQQCSRFHLLVEFDEAKRSCRKRLDGHNRRRRKPQLEPFTISSECSFSNHKGIGLLPFSVPQLFPPATDRISMWTGAIKTDDDAKVYIRHQDNSPVPVLQNQPGHEVSFGERLNVIASSQNNELTGVIDSECALSLLSLPQPIQASGISFGHSIPLAPPLVAAGLQYNNVLPLRYQSLQMEHEPMDTVLGSDSREPEQHCQDVFHTQIEDGSEHVSPPADSPQTFPFSWE